MQKMARKIKRHKKTMRIKKIDKAMGKRMTKLISSSKKFEEAVFIYSLSILYVMTIYT